MPAPSSLIASCAAASIVPASAGWPTSARFGVGRPDGAVRDTHQGDAGLADPAVGDGDHGGDADEGEVAVTTRDLLERPARAVGTGRDPDLGQQLVVGHRRREVPDEEVVGRHDALDRARSARPSLHR